MSRRRFWFIAGAVALFALAGYAALRANRHQTAVETRNAFTLTRDLPSPLTGKAAPAGRFTLTDGTAVEMADLKGKTVLLSFWSSF